MADQTRSFHQQHLRLLTINPGEELEVDWKLEFKLIFALTATKEIVFAERRYFRRLLIGAICIYVLLRHCYTIGVLLVPLLNAFCVQLKFKTLTNIKYQPFTQPQA